MKVYRGFNVQHEQVLLIVTALTRDSYSKNSREPARPLSGAFCPRSVRL